MSVVLPFRDAAATLDDAVNSIAQQSLAGFECLLVDNGSGDTSTRIARRLSEKDRRFRYVRHEGSFVGALNIGIDAARAPLIARMDADDLAHPERLEQQVAAFAVDPGLSIVSCLVSCFPRSELRDGMRRYETWLNQLRTAEEIRNALFIESPLAHPSVLLSRCALEAAGRYRETEGPEDYDLWMRLLLKGHRAFKVPRVLLHWRESPGRSTRVDPRYRRTCFLETKLRHFPSVVSPGSAVQIWGTGPTGRRWARQLRQRGYPVRRFLDVVPHRIGRYVQGVPVDAPHPFVRGTGFILSAVGLPGGRECIDSWLQQHGLRPWDDYLAVA